MTTTPRRLATLLALGALTFTLVPTSASANTTSASCAGGSVVHSAVHGDRGGALLTADGNEARNANRYGFGASTALFSANLKPGAGLVPVHRLYNPTTFAFVWIPNQPTSNELALATTRSGFTNQKVEFYASPSRTSSCTVPVKRLSKLGQFRFTTTDTEANKLKAAGWSDDGVRFWVAPAQAPAPTPVPTPPPTVSPADADGRFSIAVIPDTQNEVLNAFDQRGPSRTSYLLRERNNLDLRYVAHSGDFANWITPGLEQYKKAASDLAPITAAGLPLSVAIGNHDTGAVCTGGSACPGVNVPLAARDTRAANTHFPVSTLAPNGVFEAGKIDNSYKTFKAAGEDWMVLTLELWPRTEAVNWSKKVVAAHPNHNVVVVTHAYLEGDGSISGSNGGYGANSPRYLYDNLIKVYPNIKMVFSGHVGVSASRTDTGVNGNKIASFLGTFHSGTNPVRLLEIDVKNGTLKSRFYAPLTGETYAGREVTVTGMKF